MAGMHQCRYANSNILKSKYQVKHIKARHNKKGRFQPRNDAMIIAKMKFWFCPPKGAK
jgi:hypothetical protein